jgi:uncharacterized protein YbjT (DUF2867 family)
MNKKIKVVVSGGTGTVGSQVVSELLKRNAQVSVLTRRPDAKLPPGVQAVRGDLGDVQTIRTAFKGFDGLFLLNLVGPGEANEGILGVDGARLGGIKRLVYLSVHKADEAPHLPHFGCKLGVEAAVKASGAQWTILRPNNFYQNDFWFKDVIKQGIYPQPLGDVGLSRVDVRDIAEAAAIALVDGRHSGQTYNLVGPDILTGARTAQIWSAALGKPVSYAGHSNMDEWERQAAQMLPPLTAFDFRLMYEFIQKSGLKATPADIDRQTQLLGHPPRKFEDFVKEAKVAF